MIYAGTDSDKDNTEEDTAYQGMTKNLSGFLEIIRSDEMGHLNGKTCRKGSHQRSHQPCGGFYQSDTG